MTGLLLGKVAFITGAARGQGRAHAVRMAREGADIIALDLAAPLAPSVPYDSATPDDLAETVRLVKNAGGQVISAAADIRDFDGLRRIVDEGVAEFGRLDVIVANAGICVPCPWNQITPEAFDAMLSTNVTGTWNTVMAGAQHIIDGGRGGAVILTSSFAGAKVQPFMVHYTTTKHALVGMARAFAAELGRHDIRVNTVHPGPVVTPMGSGDMVAALTAAAETNPGLMQMGTPFLPTWAAQPEDIANAVCWLASDEARLITGTGLSIDQGMAQF
jgi:SDR family mycofactocin-dependent oxidoreductase